MINKKQVKKYCCEDISLIENYDKASKDLVETWDIHHRKEDEGYSYKELIDKGLYYKRPASELKFLTRSEHNSLHCKMRAGEKNPMYGKHLSEETRRKISEAKKGKTGKKCYLYGRTGEKHPKSKPVQQIDKNTGQVIKTWSCTMEVQRVLGINQSRISQCCSGKQKSAGGYIWRYA